MSKNDVRATVCASTEDIQSALKTLDHCQGLYPTKEVKMVCEALRERLKRELAFTGPGANEHVKKLLDAIFRLNNPTVPAPGSPRYFDPNDIELVCDELLLLLRSPIFTMEPARPTATEERTSFLDMMRGAAEQAGGRGKCDEHYWPREQWDSSVRHAMSVLEQECELSAQRMQSIVRLESTLIQERKNVQIALSKADGWDAEVQFLLNNLDPELQIRVHEGDATEENLRASIAATVARMVNKLSDLMARMPGTLGSGPLDFHPPGRPTEMEGNEMQDCTVALGSPAKSLLDLVARTEELGRKSDEELVQIALRQLCPSATEDDTLLFEILGRLDEDFVPQFPVAGKKP